MLAVLINLLVGPSGKYLNFNDFTNQFPHIRVTFLVYEGIISAIRRYRLKVNVQLKARFSLLDTKVWTIIQRGNTVVQATNVKSEAIPAAVKTWNENLMVH